MMDSATATPPHKSVRTRAIGVDDGIVASNRNDSKGDITRITVGGLTIEIIAHNVATPEPMFPSTAVYEPTKSHKKKKLDVPLNMAGRNSNKTGVSLSCCLYSSARIGLHYLPTSNLPAAAHKFLPCPQSPMPALTH